MTGGDRTSKTGLIHRPRLDRLLVGRFEHRLTTIVAPAGAGKTSALSLAMENNRLDPRGVDIMIELSKAHDSRLRLIAELLEAVDVAYEPEHTDEQSLRRLVDAVWTRAPDEVALVLDDVQFLSDPDAMAVVRDLLELLPRNGHLVLASRRAVDVPSARLQAHAQVLEISSHDLEFDDDELHELREIRARPESTDLPRHAATADLRLAAGSSASTGFLREEVLAGLPADRLEQLRRVSLLDEIDDDIVRELSGGEFDAEMLIGLLPLVERRAGGTFRLHALLREALAADHEETERRKAATISADLMLRRGEHAEAMRLHLLAGNEVFARDIARAFVSEPTVSQSTVRIAEVARLVESFDSHGPLLEMLQTSRRFNGLVEGLVEPIFQVAASARACNDAQMEAVALHRGFQALFFNMMLERVEGPELDRLAELASIVPFARASHAHVISQLEQRRGNSAGALAALADYVHFGPEHATIVINQRLTDLGRVEEVGDGLSPDDLANLPEGAEIFIAYAMWLRGEGSPEFANEFVSGLLIDMEHRGIRDAVESALGVATSIALAAGDVVEATRRVQRARDLSRMGTPRLASLFASVAAASLAAEQQSDEAAAALLSDEATGAAFGLWPHRAHLLAMPLLYLCRPDTRPTLDRIEFGPSLTTAVAAGRALVALRDDDDPVPAAELPWTQLHILRVHLLPHHLTELACAAAARGVAAAIDALREIPNLDRHLARTVGTGGPAAAHAAVLLGSRPVTAPHALRLDLLGPICLWLDDELVVADDWTRRVRLRELLALLAERRRLSRSDVIGLMWSDHPDDAKASANLRANLSRLQRVLEPDRGQGDGYFLTTDGDVLSLHDDVATDVELFEQAIETARQADAAGAPLRALEAFGHAIDLYRGDYLMDLDVGWAVLTRLRLRSLAVGAMCRVGELVAARGEPEQAAQWAERAQRLDPLSERAAAIFVSALGAIGDRTAARTAAETITSRFEVAGLGLGRSTARAFERFL
ncbi:MAG: BTAD domain-containing putative transcriptional regulator [Ilumatobacter sp.]|uniref:BTAD domain-containing putative transcriptional regulator n=1 Tax=Ilumatobacter sp. TaxID=1967498 RepID=UPI00391BF8FA